MFSLPVNSGWKPVPISSKAAIFPFMSISPLDGLVISAKTFNKVDLPAPFLPIIPKTYPLFTSKLISFNAHTYSPPFFVLSF